jgi:hypothetical protein
VIVSDDQFLPPTEDIVNVPSGCSNTCTWLTGNTGTIGKNLVEIAPGYSYSSLDVQGLAVDGSGNIIFTQPGGIFIVDGKCTSYLTCPVKTIESGAPLQTFCCHIAILGETRAGRNVHIGFQLQGGYNAFVSYSSVLANGITSVLRQNASHCQNPSIVEVGGCFQISFSGSFTSATVSIPYNSSISPAGVSATGIRLYRIDLNGSIHDVTTKVDASTRHVLGSMTKGFGYFVAALRAAQTTTASSTSTNTGATTSSGGEHNQGGQNDLWAIAGGAVAVMVAVAVISLFIVRQRSWPRPRTAGK